MPREHINAVSPPFYPIVGWGIGTDVQVATGVDGGRSIFWQLMEGQLGPLGHKLIEVFDGWTKDIEERKKTQTSEATDEDAYYAAERLAAATLNALDATTIMTYDSLWATLDRSGVNEMIRVLRRARDQAFGKDE